MAAMTGRTRDVGAACSIRGSWLPALALSNWYLRCGFRPARQEWIRELV